ncbi:hypothetical protein [Paenibacillus koleovorans]|uniref:hypothetical protein n=1 Tax=Paenibacillus koleovorans TaxID=121608 RepID=UPI0013E2ED30|nr:hypothetical protein [Paenibacillus koleovorans]
MAAPYNRSSRAGFFEERSVVRSLRRLLAETNPLVDHPTCRLLRLMLQEEEDMLRWGEHAIAALRGRVNE